MHVDFLRKTKKVSRVLFAIWISAIAFMSTYMWVEIFSTEELGLVVFSYIAISVYFWLPIIIIEYKNQFAKNARKKEDRYLAPSKVVFATCFVMSLIGIIACLTDNTANGESIPPTIMFGIVAIISGLISLKAPKTRGEARKRKEERRVLKKEIHQCDNMELYESDEILIDGMDGHQFEYFCADLLRENGFTKVVVTKGSGDQGVDVLALKDGVKYAIQCKNYSSRLGNTPVQEVNAGKVFYHCHVGVVMTNSYFTQGAVELAKATGVLLWDRSVLERLIVRAKTREKMEKEGTL